MKKILFILMACGIAAPAQTFRQAVTVKAVIASNTVATLGVPATVYTPGAWQTNDIWTPGATELFATNLLDRLSSLNALVATNTPDGSNTVITIHWYLPKAYAVWQQGFWQTNQPCVLSGGTNMAVPSIAIGVTPDTNSVATSLGLGTNTYPHWSQFTIPAGFPTPAPAAFFTQ
jgi:hypothetical protein